VFLRCTFLHVGQATKLYVVVTEIRKTAIISQRKSTEKDLLMHRRYLSAYETVRVMMSEDGYFAV
jgi:hypothetical protein